MKLQHATQWKSTTIGILLMALGVWKVFFTNEVNGYEWAYYSSIIGGVLLVLSPDNLLTIILNRTKNGTN